MIVPDASLLIYAYAAGTPQHSASKEWWEETLSGSENVGLAWITILAFIRVLTLRRLLLTPAPLPFVLSAVEQWLERPRVSIVEPGVRHSSIMFPLLTAAGAAGNLTSDAHLAAIAIENNATLYSNDADFARFPGLRYRNPLR